jgi:hypothetical protein
MGRELAPARSPGPTGATRVYPPPAKNPVWPLHAKPGFGTSAWSPWLMKLNPYD